MDQIDRWSCGQWNRVFNKCFIVNWRFVTAIQHFIWCSQCLTFSSLSSYSSIDLALPTLHHGLCSTNTWLFFLCYILCFFHRDYAFETQPIINCCFWANISLCPEHGGWVVCNLATLTIIKYGNIRRFRIEFNDSSHCSFTCLIFFKPPSGLVHFILKHIHTCERKISVNSVQLKWWWENIFWCALGCF